MDSFFAAYQKSFADVLEHARQEASQLRTGRASPALVEGLVIEAYGTKTPLKGLASISCPEPKTITIQPWDRTIVKDIERVLGAHGMTARIAGDVITVTLPLFTEQDRRGIVKILNGKMEEMWVRLRKTREEIRDRIMKESKDGTLTEDDKYRLLKELDEEVRRVQNDIAELETKKTAEIMTI